MTDQSNADTEARVRTALERLADSHEPDLDRHWPSSHHQGGRSWRPQRNRWWLAAASAIIVIAGITALAIVRGPDATVAPTDSAAPTTQSSATTTVPPDTTSPAAAVDGLRFDRPFDDAMIARLEPAPATPEQGYDLGVDATSAGITVGRESFDVVWVLADDNWVGSLAVIDESVPWDVATEGHAITKINGIDAVIDDDGSRVALRRDTGVRLIQSNNDGPADADLLAGAIELAGVVGIKPITESLPTERFVVPGAVAPRGPMVRYGEANDVADTTEVVLFRFDDTPTTDELRWMATSISQGNQPAQLDTTTFTGTLDGGQRALLEMVSPLDAVNILAPANADLEHLRESLRFEPLDDSDLTIEDVDPGNATSDVVARGTQDWGQWQVAQSPDGTCRSITTALFTPGELTPTISGASTCDPDQPFSPAICSPVGPGRTLVIVLNTDNSNVAISVNDQSVRQAVENGQGAAFVLVEHVPTGPNPINVTANGTDLACSPV